MERRSNGVSGNGRNGGNIGGRFGRDGMRFGWDLMAKGWSGIWFMTSPCGLHLILLILVIIIWTPGGLQMDSN